ncbi:hypothetical protein LCGC14_0385620 [marine sediment metagenome]|uniref:Uncharacterized protein n=1 Tax=marine sediment metagenome TaxID=412755 RepID=A0A0F9T103_9ZZZZ|nr:MAG: hypothetical protein Lokiarch_34100 [Candidatus Lokiarchaeum sp. GC14_75]
MPSDPESAINELMQSDPNIIAGAVLKGKDIIYTTDNWDISGDVSKVVSSWIGQSARFIMVTGVKYSMLKMTSELLVAMSYKGEGSIVAAKDDEHKLIVYVGPEGQALGTAMDVQRVITSLSTQSPQVNTNTQMGQQAAQSVGVSSGGATSVGGTSLDPQLQGEIKTFLDWIKDTEGLAGYVSYYLQQNNSQIISELSKIYNELRQIFGV